jgi:tetratricopeptide (TPR) repeat protein
MTTYPRNILLAAVLLAAPLSGLAQAQTTGAKQPDGAQPQASKEQMVAAKQFFVRGQDLYRQGKYEAAWIEFSSAYEIAPLPDLVFNLARCEAKMNRTKEAISHYQEFLRMRPDDAESGPIRDEVARLDRQLKGLPDLPPPSAAPPPEPKRPFPLYSAIAGGGTVLFLILGGATYGVAKSRFGGLQSSCMTKCTDSDVSSVRSPLNASYAMFGLMAAAAVATAIVLPFELGLFKKKDEQASTVALLLGPASLTVAGRF